MQVMRGVAQAADDLRAQALVLLATILPGGVPTIAGNEAGHRGEGERKRTRKVTDLDIGHEASLGTPSGRERGHAPDASDGDVIGAGPARLKRTTFRDRKFARCERRRRPGCGAADAFCTE
jgi:hypothetical protein